MRDENIFEWIDENLPDEPEEWLDWIKEQNFGSKPRQKVAEEYVKELYEEEMEEEKVRKPTLFGRLRSVFRRLARWISG